MSNTLIPQERAESLLNPHLPAFGRCFIQAEADWLRMPSEFRKDCTDSLKARFYWERANLHARRTFEQVQGARLMPYGGVPMVEIDGMVWVRFKKMRTDRSTVGYATVQRLTFESQGHVGWSTGNGEQLTFAWGGPRPILVCGYVLDQFGRITGLYIAHPAGRRNAYDFPIPMAAASAFVLPAAMPETPAVEPSVPIVRPREAK